MFGWFKKEVEFKTPAPPAVVVEAPREIHVSEDSGPKVRDYPRSKYTAYWEIFNQESPEHGYQATLRFMNFNGSVLDESVFVNRYPEDLKKQVYSAIVSKMNKYRKG